VDCSATLIERQLDATQYFNYTGWYGSKGFYPNAVKRHAALRPLYSWADRMSIFFQRLSEVSFSAATRAHFLLSAPGDPDFRTILTIVARMSQMAWDACARVILVNG
jgi:hypothetical protein